MASYKHLLDKRKHDFCPKIVKKFDKKGYKVSSWYLRSHCMQFKKHCPIAMIRIIISHASCWLVKMQHDKPHVPNHSWWVDHLYISSKKIHSNPTLWTPNKYRYLNIMNSFLYSWGKKAPSFSPHLTQLMWTFSMAHSVSVLMMFDCMGKYAPSVVR